VSVPNPGNIGPNGPDPEGVDSRGIGIPELARMLGVPMPTLRSWELRYGIPHSTRGRGQHRRYLPAEVNALRLMRDEIARGQPAGVAARTVLQMLDSQGPARKLIQQILAAAERLDAASIGLHLDQAVTVMGLDDCIDDVLLPAMRQVGIWWAAGRCDVVHEQVATVAVRGWLDRRSALAPRPARAAQILLTCGPSDLHTIGLESTAVLLGSRGWPCRVLGARTCTAAVTTAAAATPVAAVVVVSHLATARLRAVETIRAVDALGIDVFYAGNAFGAPRSRRRVPGGYLGGRVQDACSQLISVVTGRDCGSTDVELRWRG